MSGWAKPFQAREGHPTNTSLYAVIIGVKKRQPGRVKPAPVFGGRYRWGRWG